MLSISVNSSCSLLSRWSLKLLISNFNSCTILKVKKICITMKVYLFLHYSIKKYIFNRKSFFLFLIKIIISIKITGKNAKKIIWHWKHCIWTLFLLFWTFFFDWSNLFCVWAILWIEHLYLYNSIKKRSCFKHTHKKKTSIKNTFFFSF